MKLEEMLLILLMEECNKISQRCSKALRFGLQEVQPEQPVLLTNMIRILDELADQRAVLEILVEERVFDSEVVSSIMCKQSVDNKKEKVRKYLEYSKTCGRLE